MRMRMRMRMRTRMRMRRREGGRVGSRYYIFGGGEEQGQEKSGGAATFILDGFKHIRASSPASATIKGKEGFGSSLSNCPFSLVHWGRSSLPAHGENEVSLSLGYFVLFPTLPGDGVLALLLWTAIYSTHGVNPSFLLVTRVLVCIGLSVDRTVHFLGIDIYVLRS
jgi:hypothetical protein